MRCEESVEERKLLGEGRDDWYFLRRPHSHLVDSILSQSHRALHKARHVILAVGRRHVCAWAVWSLLPLAPKDALSGAGKAMVRVVRAVVLRLVVHTDHAARQSGVTFLACEPIHSRVAKRSSPRHVAKHVIEGTILQHRDDDMLDRVRAHMRK